MGGNQGESLGEPRRNFRERQTARRIRRTGRAVQNARKQRHAPRRGRNRRKMLFRWGNRNKGFQGEEAQTLGGARGSGTRKRRRSHWAAPVRKAGAQVRHKLHSRGKLRQRLSGKQRLTRNRVHRKKQVRTLHTRNAGGGARMDEADNKARARKIRIRVHRRNDFRGPRRQPRPPMGAERGENKRPPGVHGHDSRKDMRGARRARRHLRKRHIPARRPIRRLR